MKADAKVSNGWFSAACFKSGKNSMPDLSRICAFPGPTEKVTHLPVTISMTSSRQLTHLLSHGSKHGLRVKHLRQLQLDLSRRARNLDSISRDDQHWDSYLRQMDHLLLSLQVGYEFTNIKRLRRNENTRENRGKQNSIPALVVLKFNPQTAAWRGIQVKPMLLMLSQQSELSQRRG